MQDSWNGCRCLYLAVIKQAWDEAFYDKSVEDTVSNEAHHFFRGGGDWYRSRKAVCHYARIEPRALEKAYWDRCKEMGIK